MSQRLQKLMAEAGLGSRRSCEELIRQGKVEVNGRVAKLGDKADPGQDRILVDGSPLPAAEAPVYLMLNKPRGVLSSLQSQGGLPTVDSVVDVPQRVYPVGRLDRQSEGLVLLTNDGELTHRLSHPRFEHEKEYHVLLDRPPNDRVLKEWRAGPRLAELGQLAPAVVEPLRGRPGWLRIVLHEGKKHQIRDTAAHFGYQVKALIRKRIGPLKLGDLAAGAWRHLTPEEIDALHSGTGVGESDLGSMTAEVE
ncbi:MAG TPA: pseudouridine synthase [Anaerolineales bacterium]